MSTMTIGADLIALAKDANEMALCSTIARFCGISDFGEYGTLEWWTLTRDIPGHPQFSTVGRETILAYFKSNNLSEVRS